MARRKVPLNNVVGIIVHCTVSGRRVSKKAIENYCKKGRKSVPGPLYNELIHRDGDYEVLEPDHKANHAGRISSKRFKRLCKGKRCLSYPCKYPDDMTANSRLYGISLTLAYKENPTEAQYETLLDRCEEAMDKFNLEPYNVWGHADLTRRKIDPWRPFSPNKFMFKVTRDLKKREKLRKKNKNNLEMTCNNIIKNKDGGSGKCGHTILEKAS